MLLDANDRQLVQKYDDFIAQSEFGNFYQSRQWSKVKDNWKPCYFYLMDHGEITAALSVMSIQDSVAGKEFFYAPRGPVCDLRDLDTVSALIDEVREYALKNNGFLLRLDPEVAHEDELVRQYAKEDLHFLKNPALTSQPLMSLILEIRGRSAEEVLSDFSKSTRKEIRSSYRHGVKFHVGQRSDLETFHKFLVEMSEKKKIGYRPLDYFVRVYDVFGEKSRLYFASYADELIAGGLMIGFNKTLTGLYRADPIHVNKNQSAQMQFENIKYAIDEGYGFYDLGGIYTTDINDGLYKFKQKFTENNVVHWIGNLDIVLDQEAYDKYYTHHMERFDWSKVDVSKENILKEYPR
ncbi:MAG TPA: aminoacyltransferase [Clostridiaceae bacterium]|nr:aminoacyltransferase [Clostridiaceae bacterium]